MFLRETVLWHSSIVWDRGNEICRPLPFDWPTLCPQNLAPCSPATLSPSLAPRGWGLSAAGSSLASLPQRCSWVGAGGGWEWGSGSQIRGPQSSLVHRPHYFSSTVRERGTCKLPVKHAEQVPGPRVQCQGVLPGKPPPCTRLLCIKSLCILLTPTLWGRCYHPHVTDEATEARDTEWLAILHNS